MVGKERKLLQQNRTQERLLRKLSPAAREALTLARRLTGQELRIRGVSSLPGSVRGRLVRPDADSARYEIQYLRRHEALLDHLVAHEVGHLVRLYAVPEAERLAAQVSPETRRRALSQLLPELAAYT